jgi:hypothetical protein
MLVEQVLFARETAPSQGITILGSASVGAAVAWIRYEGTVGSGATLAIDATYGDLAATTDGTTADTQWLESGGTAGTIDTSDANGNSWGEVIDIINGCDNWCGVLLAAQRSDLTSNTILTVAEVDMSTAAMKATGLYLFHDPVVADQTSIYSVAHAISAFNPAGYVKGDDPDEGCVSVVTYIKATSDFSAAGQVVLVNADLEGSTKMLTLALADNTATTWGNLAAPIFRSKVGHRLIVRVENDQNASANATKLEVAGYTIDLTGKKNPCDSYPITNASG